MAKQEPAETPKLVFAQENLVLHDKSGLPFALVGGQAWLASDPLVKQHPGSFGDEPPYRFMGRSVYEAPKDEYPVHREEPANVEQATHEPGEVRG